MLQFILERYNYWIVIILMMTGLYIVFSRGNLVKKIIGLNIFQTSVFIFYITIGKIAGGTAPIFIGGHGDDHGEGHGGGHGEKGNELESHDTHGANEHSGSQASDHDGTDHASGANAESLHNSEHLTQSAEHSDKVGNPFAQITNKDLSAIINDHDDVHGGDALLEGDHLAEGSLHALPNVNDGELASKISNSILADAKAELKGGDALALEVESETEELVHALADKTVQTHSGAIDGAHHGEGVAEIIYSNPLPHVLILTAIVVGVATTAVGLALAVRIREAYGTIEEDELEAADDIAEFGREGSYDSAPELASGHISEAPAS